MLTFEHGQAVLVNLSQDFDAGEWEPATYFATLQPGMVTYGDGSRLHLVSIPRLVVAGRSGFDRRQLPDDRIKPAS